MGFVADLHIHSRFSRACSKDLNIPNLATWAKLKGIDMLGTGDCLHSIWSKELKSTLMEDSNGYFYQGVRFIPTVELSCIYSEREKVHKIHILVFFPSLESASKVASELTKRGMNLSSDGRPILGISSRDLVELILALDSRALIVPAHIWTSWFSLYGSKSGYDSFEECFGEFSDRVYAVETGLSSEPAMNWRIKDLDTKAIVSFSDAHSLPRLGREVTIFNGECSFEGLSKAIKENDLVGTIEFFPEEGKYHFTGHRNCGVVYSPEELKEKGKICPVCKAELTVGVMQRIEDLAVRSKESLELIVENGVTKSKAFPDRPGFRMLVQLEEIIAESLGLSVSSQKVKDEYLRLVSTLDSELKILTKTPMEDITRKSSSKLADGIKRVRDGILKIQPGFDNTYGVVKIFDDESPVEQTSLF